MAMKGACEGTDFEEIGEELAQEWSSKWSGRNDPVYDSKTYRENRPKAGWRVLTAEVEKHAGVSLRLEEAQAVFGASPLLVEPNNPRATTTRPRLRLLTVQDLLTLPKPRWLIDGMLPENSLAEVFGESGSFKSFLALDMALSIAAGSDYHGRPTLQGTVVNVCAERFYGTRKRVLAWAAVRGIAPESPPIHFIGRAIDVRNGSEDLKALREELAKIAGPIRFVVIDTLNRNLQGDENSSADMRDFIAGCDEIREATRAAVAVVHHTGWSQKDRSRGHSSFKAAVDTEMKVERERRSFTVTLSCTKQKDSAEFDAVCFQLEPYGFGDDGSLVPRLDTGGPASADDRKWTLLQHLRDAEPEGLTGPQWYDVAGGNKADHLEVRRALLEAGLVRFEKAGRSGQYHLTSDGETALAEHLRKAMEAVA
jgi:hypothetical protein